RSVVRSRRAFAAPKPRRARCDTSPASREQRRTFGSGRFPGTPQLVVRLASFAAAPYCSALAGLSMPVIVPQTEQMYSRPVPVVGRRRGAVGSGKSSGKKHNDLVGSFLNRAIGRIDDRKAPLAENLVGVFQFQRQRLRARIR